jgi:hypothetical protein
VKEEVERAKASVFARFFLHPRTRAHAKKLRRGNPAAQFFNAALFHPQGAE